MLKLTQVFMVATLTALSNIVTISKPTYGQSTTFYCDRRGGEFFTFMRTEDRRKYKVMQFALTDFPPPYNNIKSRCEEVSSRFQRSYDNGTLNKIVVGRLNNQPVICATKEIGTPCDHNNLLFTLTTQSQAKDISKRLFNPVAVGNSKYVTANGSDDINFDFNRYLENLQSE
ncbi:hypothetical protein H6F32_03845 [Anabaena sp. FACHB-1237]|uniref:COP23 domain-containing protein n=1 Tax=Anabaena sp. FACHB-1237 TaxID=2692769 RepID=UPI001680E816|nr:COP23 domain-containing protein [Anabaena sp. FACHB-1237]MBD2136740.1 hypothetical protein [Anabaena sp. FACHB-1237]